MKHVIVCPHCGESAATVTVSALEMRTESNPGWLQEFIAAHCVIEPNASVTVGHFREAYERWATETGAPIVSSRRLGVEVLKLPGVNASRTGQGRLYRGIRLSTGKR